MRIFGSITELVAAVFRKNSQAITLRPNQATTYTASRDIQLPPGDAAHVIVSADSTQTLTNKSIDADTNTITNIENADIKAAAAIDATKIADGSVSNAEFQALNGVSGTLVDTNSVQTLTNKTLDGDDNTIQDLALTSLKTVLGDANKVVRRDAAGVVVSDNAVPNSSALVTTDSTSTLTNKTIDADGTGNAISNIDDGNIKSAAAIAATKIADGSVDNTEFQRLGTAGTAGAGNLVTTDGTQDLTNKELTAPLIDNYAEFNEEATPATPAAGLVRLYPKSDGNFYKIADDGIEQQVGSSSGSGEVNVVRSPSTALNWNEVGSVFATPTTVTSSLPLASSVSPTAIEITGTGNGVISTDYVAHSCADTTGINNTKLKFEFYYDRGTGFVAGEWEVAVFRGGVQYPLSTDTAGQTLLPDADGKFVGYFDNIDGTPEIRIAKIAGAGAGTIRITRVIIGPGIQPAGAAVSEAEAYTPDAGVNQGLGTLATSEMTTTRMGSKSILEGKITLGTVAASEARLAIPDGLTIGAITGNHVVGRWYRDNSTTLNIKSGSVIANPGDGYLLFSSDDYTGIFSPLTAQNGDDIFTTGDVISIENVIVPIAEWSGNGVMQLAENAVEYASNSDTADADDTTSFAYGPAGSIIPTVNSSVTTASRKKRVRFNSPILSTDIITIEVLVDTGAGTLKWSPVEMSGDYVSATSTETSIRYGIGYTSVTASENEIDITFYRGGRTLGNTFGNNGANYPGTAQDRWRVRKLSQNAALGFALATANASGLVGQSGPYSPTITPGTNTSAASLISAHYTQVSATQVQVSVVGSITVTAGSTLSQFSIDLPIASTISAANISGTATWISGTALGSGFVETTGTDASVRLVTTNNAAGTFAVNFTYEII